ncbi:tetratricopeptide repeat protein [Planctomicrobium sp. SH527]|uniref:tetratricopeptide repeat protein n=1 Tax=Planctomicrobium sp. SH527 TaxID=3448123 RepID=UPI003F5BBF60
MNRTAKYLLLWTVFVTGCSTTSHLTGWGSKGQKASKSLAQDEKAKSGNNADIAANKKSIQDGQREIAAWYSDHQPQRLNQAKEHFLAVLQRSPQNSEAHHGIAIVADLEKNYTQAERHYQQALVQNPNNSDILGDLGYSYLLQNRLSESERYSLMALQANPANQKAQKHLGDVYAKQGKAEQAQEAYAKVMSLADAERTVTENTQKTSETAADTSVAHNSLMSKLLQKKTPGEKFTEEYDRMRRERDGAGQNVAGQPGGPNPNAGPLRGRPASNADLRERLAQIDKESGAAASKSGPLLLDDQTGKLTRIPEGEAMIAAGTGVPATMTAAVAANSNTPTDAAIAESAPANSANTTPAAESTGAVQAGTAPATGAVQVASAEVPAQTTVQPTGQPATPPAGTTAPATSVPGQQPWSGIQMASASVAGNHPQAGVIGPQGQVVPAMGQGLYDPVMQGGNNSMILVNQQMPTGQQPGQPASVGQPASNASGQPYLPPSGMTGLNDPMAQQSVFPNANGPANGDASRLAARMGMGFGASSTFNGTIPTTPINPPGAMNYQSMGIAPPDRAMPDDRPVQDLRQAFQPYSTPVASPALSQGIRTPTPITPMQTRQQYGNAVQYDTQTMQNSNIPEPSWNAMQGYEVQRWKAGQQLNRNVQQIWAKGPMNSPMSPSAGSQYFYPNSTGPTFTPNPPAAAGGVTPPAWPYAQQAVPDQSVLDAMRTNNGPTSMTLQEHIQWQQQQAQQQAMIQQQALQQQYQQQQQANGAATTPPEYRSGMQATPSGGQNSFPGGTPNYNSRGAATSNDSYWPVIRPATQ